MIFDIVRKTRRVAVGVVFDSGLCVLAWNGKNRSVAVYGDLKSALAVHGHDSVIEQRALFDLDVVEGLRMNHVQDLGEIQGSVLSGDDETKKYLWRQREALADLFVRRSLP